MIQNPRNLTEYEALGLSETFNLADGHAHQEQSRTQREIISNLTDLFYEAENYRQDALEAEFKQAFFALTQQISVQDGSLALLSYSASVATEILANYLRRQNLSVALIHPTFDNIASILIREGIPVEPLDQDRLTSDTLDEYLETIKSDAIFLVCPNNPTGWVPSRAQFDQIVEHCKRHSKFLIFDFCFRLFTPTMLWDQYRLLLDADIDFLGIEDTGKAWPTLDLKISITVCNKRIFRDIHELHADVLLNVSPFTIKLLLKYIEDSKVNGIDATVRHITETNREILREGIRGTILTPVGVPTIGVEWLSINSSLTATELWDQLRRRGIYILPGRYFFWANPDMGNKNVRIALMRPFAMFRDAVKRLTPALLDIAGAA